MKRLINFFKDEEGATVPEYALMLGEQELADDTIGIKPMRSAEEQFTVALDELAETLANKLKS